MTAGELVKKLWNQDNAAAYAAMQELTELSIRSNTVYPYMREVIKYMKKPLDSPLKGR